MLVTVIQGSCLEKEMIQGTVPGARMRGRPRTAWMDNIKTWTGLPVEESIRMTEDRDKWRKYVHGVANPRMDRGPLKNRTEQQHIVGCSLARLWSVSRYWRPCLHPPTACEPAYRRWRLAICPLHETGNKKNDSKNCSFRLCLDCVYFAGCTTSSFYHFIYRLIDWLIVKNLGIEDSVQLC